MSKHLTNFKHCCGLQKKIFQHYCLGEWKGLDSKQVRELALILHALKNNKKFSADKTFELQKEHVVTDHIPFKKCEYQIYKFHMFMMSRFPYSVIKNEICGGISCRIAKGSKFHLVAEYRFAFLVFLISHLSHLYKSLTKQFFLKKWL